jgi:hypothetical protein
MRAHHTATSQRVRLGNKSVSRSVWIRIRSDPKFGKIQLLRGVKFVFDNVHNS